VTGSQDFLINNHANVQAVGQGNVIDVFHFGDGSSDIEPFCFQAGQDIGFCAACQGDESIHFLDPLCFQQFHISTIPMDDHGFRIDTRRQPVYPGPALFNHLEGEVIGQQLSGFDGNTTTSHEQDVFDLSTFFAAQPPDGFHGGGLRNVVDQIPVLNHIFTGWYERGIMSFDGGNTQVIFFPENVSQGFPQNRSPLTYLDTNKQQFALAELMPLPGPRSFEAVNNFLGSQQLGVNEGMDAQLFEERLVFLVHVFGIVDAGDCLFGAQFGSQDTGGQVAAFIGCDSDEQVTGRGARLLDLFDGCRTTHQGLEVVVGIQVR